MKTSDFALIRRTLDGDQNAFTVLVTKYQKWVHTLVWRKIGDFHIAEEITQDVFLKVYKKLSMLKPSDHFTGWLYVIATRHCIAWFRKKRLPTTSLDAMPISELSETDPTEVETRRFQTLHTQAGAHLHTHTDVDTSRGLRTTRTLTASTLLTDYSNWPGLAQVYQYRSERNNSRIGEMTSYTQYGITSLSPEVASAEDLLKLRRGHWTIENKVHWVRDTVLGEDASQTRSGGLPQVMAALRNTALSVLRFAGHTKIAETIRFLASRPKLAVNLIN